MIEFFSESSLIDLTLALSVEKVLIRLFEDYNYRLNYLNIMFISDEELLEINKEFLEHDYFTDIITFQYANEENLVEAELYISADRVKENATTNGVDFYTELNRVMIHGCLHLVGYVDDTIEAKKVMQSLEDKYVNYNVPRETL